MLQSYYIIKGVYDENKEDKELYLMLLSLDSDYFSPSEAAWRFVHSKR